MAQVLRNRNEVVQGPAPACQAVWRAFSRDQAAFYGAGYFPSVLAPVLSKLYGVAEEAIVVAYGSEDFLRTVFDRLTPGKDCLLTHYWHYSYYEKYLDFRGVKLVKFGMDVKGHAFVFDIQDCLAKIKRFTPKVIIINSPNNPTGNTISKADLKRILNAVPAKTLVVVDQAYVEVQAGVGATTFIDLLKTYPNLILLRSFSKLYALAGMRLGYALCGGAAKHLLGYQSRYLGVSRILEETAVVALREKQYYEKIRREIIQGRTWLAEQTRGLQFFTLYDSEGNFVLARIHEVVRSAFNATLDAEKVVVGKYVDVDLYRISLGWPKDTTRLVKIMQTIDQSYKV